MKKAKVLIADDNEHILSSLEIQLLVFGYEVVTCTNVDLAVAYAQKHKPDVILADIWMDPDRRIILSPTGNGFGLLERIKQFPEICGIPVIYITGNSSAQLDATAKQLGAYGLIRKPINFSGLLEMIDAAVKDSRPCSELPDAEDNQVCKVSAASDFSKIS